MAVRRKALLGCVLGALTSAVAFGAFVASRGPIDWEPSPTHDPELVAAGDALLKGLAIEGDVQRDPYGSACGIPDTSLCAWSPSLTPRDLVDALGAQVVKAGGRLAHRECADDDVDDLLPSCGAWYVYRGAQVGLLAGDSGALGRVPAYVFGTVVSDVVPPEREPVPLGSLVALGAVPDGWQTPACSVPAGSGCLGYSGPISGAPSATDAHVAALTTLRASGFRIDSDRCLPGSTGGQRCVVTAHKFRSLGGRDGATVTLLVKPSDANGFVGLLRASADGVVVPVATPATTAAPQPG